MVSLGLVSDSCGIDPAVPPCGSTSPALDAYRGIPGEIHARCSALVAREVANSARSLRSAIHLAC